MSRNKQAGDLWSGFNTFPRLLRGYQRAAKRKYDRDSVASFNAKLERNIITIRDELEAGTYKWGIYRAFWVMAPKLRKIEAAPFRDRITHQAMAEVLEPLFDPGFYHHSYACRSGRGTHRAMYTLREWILKNPNSFYLQMDVSKYFPSINRDILYQMIEKRIMDPRFLALTKSLLDSSPGQIGIPIGNLTSQIFANLYLNALDQFIKRELRVKFYVRYMDDIVLLGERDQLIAWKIKIEVFAKEKLHLRFHPHKVALACVKEGISFVGYRILHNKIRIRSGSLRRFRKNLRTTSSLDKKVKKIISYEGHLGHADGCENIMADLRKIAFSKEAWSL